MAQKQPFKTVEIRDASHALELIRSGVRVTYEDMVAAGLVTEEEAAYVRELALSELKPIQCEHVQERTHSRKRKSRRSVARSANREVSKHAEMYGPITPWNRWEFSAQTHGHHVIAEDARYALPLRAETEPEIIERLIVSDFWY